MLGIVFVLLVCFLRRGLDRRHRRSVRARRRHASRRRAAEPDRRCGSACARRPRWQPGGGAGIAAAPSPRRPKPIATRPDPAGDGLTKRYGGLRRQRRHRFLGRARRAARHHRPQRRRQITFFKMLTCEVQPTAGQHRVRRPRHHRHERHRRVPARPDQELSGQPAVHPADRAREPHHRGARRTARQFPPRPVAPCRRESQASPSRSSDTLDARRSHRARRHAGVRARLWREAPPRDRPGARHLAEPACCSTSRSPA